MNQKQKLKIGLCLNFITSIFSAIGLGLGLYCTTWLDSHAVDLKNTVQTSFGAELVSGFILLWAFSLAVFLWIIIYSMYRFYDNAKELRKLKVQA